MGHSGPDHLRTFNFRAVVGEVTYDPGNGRNKKEAKREAAALALQSLGFEVNVGKNL